MNQARSPALYQKTLFFILSLTVLGYLLYHTLAGGDLLTPNVYDNYALQAQSWLNGRLDVENGASYTWLELAIFQGSYYVSFPPVPTLVVLPFVALFGMSPSNLLIALYAIAACIAVFQCCRTVGLSPAVCGFWALFFTFATNLTELSRTGAVWNQAQVLNLALCFWALWCLLSHKPTLCLLLFALAVGCRPFSAVYLAAAFCYFVWQGRKEFSRTLLRLLPGILSVCVIAAAMMLYNQVRFGNPLEFGHNYLPEFTESELGQFHPTYILPNLLQLFRLPTIQSNLAFEFPLFNGFLFFLVNPAFIPWAVRLIQGRKKPTFSTALVFSLVPFLLILLALCAHKTMGGWQFGARYTVDLLPAALLGLCLLPLGRPKRWERWLCYMGLLINVFGMVFMLIQEM